MKNILALIGLVVVGFGVVGWYCEWYSFKVTKGAEGKPEIKTTLDTERVVDDSSSFFKRVGQALSSQAQQGDSKSGQPASPPAPVAPTKGDSQRDGSRTGWFLAPSRPASQK